MTASEVPLLAIDGLCVEFRSRAGVAPVLDGVTFSLRRGRTLGLVGESGSGKSITALSIVGLIGGTGRVTAGSIKLDGRELVGRTEREMREIRGARIGMLFQEPRRSLDPSFTVGDQIAEVAVRHRALSRRDARALAVEMLDKVGIAEAHRRQREYPHAFSGGMCQRVMLAMALVGSPDLLIADEPTTALDVTVQARVLELLQGLQEELGLAILFISHDLGVIAEMSDEVAVMYAGRIVERSSTAEVFGHPRHPYTEGLLASLPQAQRRGARLTAIDGVVPSALAWPSGCRFNPRCRYRQDVCVEVRPELGEHAAGHLDACLRSDELSLRGLS